VDHTQGVWIRITRSEGTWLTLYGTEISSSQFITLRPGWNLVGFPSTSDKIRTIGLNNLTFGSDVDAIMTFDASTDRWIELGDQDDILEVGQGYWIHSAKEYNLVWEVPP
jgi:hypothetical protein